MRMIAGSAALLIGTALAAGGALAQEVADRIYSGGPILTMNDAQPRAEAVAVKDGTILAVGSVAEMSAMEGDGT